MFVIINSDDFGLSPSKNKAIDYAIKNGLCTQISLVVNTPYTQEAVAMAKEGGYTDKLSLHLNLTEGYPLSEDIKQVDLYCVDNHFIHRAIIKQVKQILPFHMKELRTEIEAQINMFLSFDIPLEHIDSHNWVHLRLPVWLALKPLLRKYHIKSVRPMWKGYWKPRIAAKWSRYFWMMYHTFFKDRTLRSIRYTSNIEQYCLVENNLTDYEAVEVFVHPDIIDNVIMDMSSSYESKQRYTLEENVDKLKNREKICLKKWYRMKEVSK